MKVLKVVTISIIIYKGVTMFISKKNSLYNMNTQNDANLDYVK
jgi:hypothetical protein